MVSIKEGNEQGQGMVEYGLIVGFIAILIISIFIVLGPSYRNMFTNTTDEEAVGEREAALSSSMY